MSRCREAKMATTLLCLWGWEKKRVQSSWEPVRYLAWVFLQQPNLVDLNVLSHVSSAPPRSWVWGHPALAPRTIKEKRRGKNYKKSRNSSSKKKWIAERIDSLQVMGTEGKKNFLLQARKKTNNPKEETMEHLALEHTESQSLNRAYRSPSLPAPPPRSILKLQHSFSGHKADD